MSLYDLLKDAVARNSDSKNTLESYWLQCRKFFAFCKKPASQWCGADVQRWIVTLHEGRYSRSSRKSALCAMAYVFKHVLKADMGKLDLPPMPPERKPLKIVPTREEIASIFALLKGSVRLAAALLYGAGLRVDECCKLRMKDIDFAALTIRLHEGKGDKDRLSVLPVMLVEALRAQMEWRAALHDYDVANGDGFVELPGRLAFKYKAAPQELRWQFLFPSKAVRDGYRWHMVPEAIQKALRGAVKEAGIIKTITPHTLRHAFATHSMRMGNDIETVRDLLGHDSIATTAIYLHADAARGASPMDVRLNAPLPFPRTGIRLVA